MVVSKDEVPEEFFKMAAAKEQRFGKKNQVGIIAKLAKNFCWNKYPSFRFAFRNWNEGIQRKIWPIILRAKFDPERNPELVKLLLDTGDSVLFEFHYRSVGASFWTARFKDGAFIGYNFMGKMLTAIREELKNG